MPGSPKAKRVLWADSVEEPTYGTCYSKDDAASMIQACWLYHRTRANLKRWQQVRPVSRNSKAAKHKHAKGYKTQVPIHLNPFAPLRRPSPSRREWPLLGVSTSGGKVPVARGRWEAGHPRGRWWACM